MSNNTTGADTCDVLVIGCGESGLLAGIVFVDWLAIAPHCPTWLGGILLLLFGSTLLAQRFVYRQLMYCVVIRAIGAATAGLGIGWGKLERTGRVNTQPPAGA